MDYALIISSLRKFSAHSGIQIQTTSNLSKQGFQRQLCREVVTPNSVLIIDELETLMWLTGKVINGGNEIIFETRVNGKPVLGNGRAIILFSRQKSKL